MPPKTDYDEDWFKDYSNVLTLARHLIDRCELLEPLEVYRLFEKPWKWTREWCDYQEHMSTTPSIGYTQTH